METGQKKRALMSPGDDWVKKSIDSRTPEEFSQALVEDLCVCYERAAAGRACVAWYEKNFSFTFSGDDRALKRLRAYGMTGQWQWSTERALAMHLAEFAEEMEAVMQQANQRKMLWLAALYELVLAVEDIRSGQGMLRALDEAEGPERAKLFEKMREDISKAWQSASQRGQKYLALFKDDPLARYKVGANFDLGTERFIHPPESQA